MMKWNFKQQICFSLLLWGLCLCATSCTEDAPVAGGMEQDDSFVEFSFTIPASRVSMEDNGSGRFEEGDRIGLYVSGTPAKHYVLTLQDGEWQPRLTRAELGSGELTLNAYYPASEEGTPETGVHAHSLAADQSGSGYTSSDLLWSHRTVDMGTLSDNRIALSFSHAMHRLRIRLTAESGALPEPLQVEVRGCMQGTLSLASGEVEADATSLGWMTPKADEKESGVYTVILYPQLLNSLQTEDGWVRVTAGEKSSVFKAPSEIGGSDKLEPGKESTLSLTLKADESVEPGDTDQEWVNAKRWVYGVTSPVYDINTVTILTPGSDNYTPGEWVCFRTDWGDGTFSDNNRLPWVKGCGWYDCNKTYMEDGASDENLCWAAASSNVLHWWLEHNAPYVEAYDRRYGSDAYYQRYPRPSQDFTPSVKSKIFKLYVNTFNNRGAGEGVSWFINGNSVYTSGIFNPDMREFKGYFKEVFSMSDQVYTINKAMGKDRFNSVVKDALKNRKAMVFTTNGNHAMTIWGAEFDETGTVSAIYYADNNWGDQDPGGASCIRQIITYRKDEAMNLDDQTYIGSIRLTAVDLIDLRQDVWKHAFPDVLVPVK